MIQKILIVKGRVQDVGYRETVKDIARDMSVFGYIRNTREGTAEIRCECKNKQQLEDFKKEIFIKNEKEYEPCVEGIEEININPPKIVLGIFTVEYGDKELEMVKILGRGNRMMIDMLDSMESANTEMKLNAVLHKEEDMFVAECPEVGTVSQGKTKKEALANLKEATKLYLEEFPIEKKITIFNATFEVTPDVKTSKSIRA